jgi:hypothetical protein
MPKTMTRGKQQILFDYLPGKTFDFERGPIARVREVNGSEQADLNETIIVSKIAEQARAWSAPFRPGLSDQVLTSAGRFVLLDPSSADADMFPKVFWCQNPACGRITDASNRDRLPPVRCSSCRTGTLAQLRWIKVHKCGAIEPLTPPPCPQCHAWDVGLRTRGSERISAFRWICHRCGHAYALFGGICRHCSWPGDQNDRNMNIEVHRAGRTFYPQTTVLLNIPHREFEGFLARPDWQFVVAAKFLGMPGFEERALTDFTGGRNAAGGAAAAGLSDAELDAIMQSGLPPAEILQRLQQARAAHHANANAADNVARDVCEQSGVQRNVWEAAGPELLEAVIPFDNPRQGLFSRASQNAVLRDVVTRQGLAEVALVQDYTILNATFGFSRSEYAPDQCWLNPFSPDRHYRGRLPIFVDRVQADALLVSLDPERVLHWLAANGAQPAIPMGTNADFARRSYFVRLFDHASLYHTLDARESERRLVFGLLHSLSHQCVKQAALMCGLEKTSLSEYVLPKALTVAIYPNHRFGATLGALTALFEQTLAEWLEGMRDNRTCVYDPVCHDHGSNCHACTHLPETSCRFYNLNLSRSFLFGGPDSELGLNIDGYFTRTRWP